MFEVPTELNTDITHSDVCIMWRLVVSYLGLDISEESAASFDGSVGLLYPEVGGRCVCNFRASYTTSCLKKYGNFVPKVSSIKMNKKVYLPDRHAHGHVEVWTRYNTDGMWIKRRCSHDHKVNNSALQLENEDKIGGRGSKHWRYWNHRHTFGWSTQRKETARETLA